MEYLLFTFPNCMKCEELKNYLNEADLRGQEYSLFLKESKLKIRDFLSKLKRDEKGAIILPTLVFKDKDEVLAVLNSRRELEDWLRSRA